jgi:hypothetical protein
MIGDARHAADRNEIAQYYASRNSHLARKHAMAPNSRVVANLHKIINFGAFTNYGIAQRGTVDCRIRPNLNTVLNNDAAELRNFPVSVLT